MADRCFCVFEGGGAKGIAHVGALAALESSGLDLCGFAGTSAGAVIAALAAAGYRSRDLIAADGTILDLVDTDETNIWSGDAFRPARDPSRLFGPVGWAGIVVARSIGGWALAALVLALVTAPPLLASFGSISPRAAPWLELAALFAVFGVASLVASGLASLDQFERGLNQLLRLKLVGRPGASAAHLGRLPAPITFADLKRAGCPPLKVVASDISTRQLRVFSAADSPAVGVAAAVAASVCLPVIFRPRRIGASLYLDGGLVSNLPAWAFDAERAVDRDARTAVVQVGDVATAERLRGLAILKGAVLTGFFGSSMLNLRNVDRLKSVRLKVRLRLLQFDPGRTLALRVVEEARLTCVRDLVYQLRDVPALMTDVCERIRIRTERLLSTALRFENKPVFAGVVRVSLFVRSPDDRASLTADFQTGFDRASDERLRLPVEGSIVGQALTEAEPLYLERRDPSWSTYLAEPGERWLRKLIWPDLRWVLCVPYVKAVDGIELVAAIDSDTYLDVAGDLVDVTLASIADAVARMLSEFVPKEAFGNVSA